MVLTIDASQMVAFAAKCDAAEPAIKNALRAGVQQGGTYIQQTERGIAPRKTGALAASIAVTISDGGNGVQALIAPHTSYAEIVEKGRGPVVAHGKALRFVIGGAVIYRKRVGPAAGRWYVRKTFAAVQGPVVTIVEHAVVPALEAVLA